MVGEVPGAHRSEILSFESWLGEREGEHRKGGSEAPNFASSFSGAFHLSPSSRAWTNRSLTGREKWEGILAPACHYISWDLRPSVRCRHPTCQPLAAPGTLRTPSMLARALRVGHRSYPHFLMANAGHLEINSFSEITGLGRSRAGS